MRHAVESEVCSLCGLTSDTVLHWLGGCTHPAINSRVKLRHGCTVDLIAHMFGMGRHGDCFMLHDAEGHDGRYRRFPDWLLDMDRLPSCPDLVLLQGTEQAQGGGFTASTRMLGCTCLKSHSRQTLPWWTG